MTHASTSAGGLSILFRAAVAMAIMGIWDGSAAHAAMIFGGPTYNSATGTGYQTLFLPVAPGFTAGNAMAVGYTSKYESGNDKGYRAVRWDVSGSAATELGTLGTDNNGVAYSFAFAINAAGTTAGYAYKYELGINKGYRAVRWDALGTAATEMGILGTDSNGFTNTLAFDINASGTMTGYARKYESGAYKGERSVRWDASGTAATELGQLGTDSSGVTNSRAYGINAAGTTVGYANKYESGSDKGSRAVRWDASGTAATELENLGTNGGGVTHSTAYAVNATGTAVGYADKYGSGSGFRAVRWDAAGTAATELGNLGTGSNGFTVSSANAVNASGTAVGFAQKYESGSDKSTRAVRWDASISAATELGNLGTDSNGVAYSGASAINASGTTVGYAHKYDLGSDMGARAVAWGLDGVSIDLNTLLEAGTGWVNLYEARGISDTNWVTGYGTFDPDGPGGLNAYNRMFLMQIPEPASLSLLALGGGAMLARRRRV